MGLGMCGINYNLGSSEFQYRKVAEPVSSCLSSVLNSRLLGVKQKHFAHDQRQSMLENIHCKKCSFQIVLSLMLQLFVKHAERNVIRPDGQSDKECPASTPAVFLQTAVLCVKELLPGMLALAEQKCQHPDPLEGSSSSLTLC